MITSPPYGDSQTTVAYGQYSRLAAEWIGLPNARKIDKLAMGGQHSKETLADSPILPAVDKFVQLMKSERGRCRRFTLTLGVASIQ